jgi:hypothetical protein
MMHALLTRAMKQPDVNTPQLTVMMTMSVLLIPVTTLLAALILRFAVMTIMPLLMIFVFRARDASTTKPSATLLMNARATLLMLYWDVVISKLIVMITMHVRMIRVMVKQDVCIRKRIVMTAMPAQLNRAIQKLDVNTHL